MPAISVKRETHAGWWCLGASNELKITYKHRPSWLQRFLMEKLLTIRWQDQIHEVQVGFTY